MTSTLAYFRVSLQARLYRQPKAPAVHVRILLWWLEQSVPTTCSEARKIGHVELKWFFRVLEIVVIVG